MRSYACVVLALLASLGTSSASTIFSNFSATPPGYVPDSYEMKVFNGLIGTEQTEWAMSFTVPPESNFLFTGFDVPLTFAGTTTTVDFTLASDAGGAPGSALETIGIALSNGTAVYSGSSALQPDLIAGTSYWLEAAIPVSFVGTEADWNAAAGLFSGMDLGPVAFLSPPIPLNWSVSTKPQAAFEIDGTAVPEPRYVWVVVLGCLFAGTRVFGLFRTSLSLTSRR